LKGLEQTVTNGAHDAVDYLLANIRRQPFKVRDGRVITELPEFFIHEKPVGLDVQGPGYFFDHLDGGKFAADLDFANITCGGVAPSRQIHLRNLLSFSVFFQIGNENFPQTHEFYANSQK
jgi:hypothetical protein